MNSSSYSTISQVFASNPSEIPGYPSNPTSPDIPGKPINPDFPPQNDEDDLVETPEQDEPRQFV